jgi:ABC-type glycerol-3-phosphate transport system permease component
MWRTALRVILSGALGSAVATLAWFVFDPLANSLASALRIYVPTLMFSIPGAAFVAVVEWLLHDRLFNKAVLNSLLVAVGTVAGEAIGNSLGLIAGLGGGYGLATAISFVAFGRLGAWRSAHAS